MARMLQTVLGHSRAGAKTAINRTSSLATMIMMGEGGGRKAAFGFLGKQAAIGAGIGIAGSVGINTIGNMATGDSPFRGTGRAILRGATWGAAGGLGTLAFKKNHAGFNHFMGAKGAGGAFYAANPGAGLVNTLRQKQWLDSARGAQNYVRGHYHGARSWLGM